MGRKYYLDPQSGEKIYIRDKVPSLKDYRKSNDQDIIDNQIKEVAERAETIARGRATGYVFDTLADLEIALEDETFVADLVLGDNLYIRATNVPDYWWDGTQKQQLEAEKPDLSGFVKDVQINDASIVTKSNGIASISRATSSIYGVIKGDPQSRLYGIDLLNPGILGLWDTSTSEVSTRSGVKAITTKVFDYAVKAAMCDGKGAEWSAEEQANAKTRLGITEHKVVRL